MNFVVETLAAHSYWLLCFFGSQGFAPSNLASKYQAEVDWDAYDNVHDHTGLMTYWGKLRWNQETGTYSPRKKFYTDALVYRHVTPGSVRIGSSSSLSSLVALAFYNASTGKLTIVGHNKEASPVVVRSRLTSLPLLTTLHLYETTVDVNLRSGSDIEVQDNSFVVDIAPDSFFAITTS